MTLYTLTQSIKSLGIDLGCEYVQQTSNPSPISANISFFTGQGRVGINHCYETMDTFFLPVCHTFSSLLTNLVMKEQLMVG